ncbi:MAG: ParB/RepB/Spo0J family partition protein [Planctomycetes bacterium]|nr:ParB/RepB/Spo0J family partition protein [Planctomycetota bacterium]
MAQERKLGRGFDDLVSDTVAFSSNEILRVPVDSVAPNRFQPRQDISGEAFESLKASIAQDGILQPVVVRPAESGYELIAGERRWRAAKDLGLEVIPVIVRQADDRHALELALVENIQREDLNPIDRALGYRRLMEGFGLTQEEAAAKVGQDRSTVANTIRLLALPDEVQRLVRDGALSMGHARALLGLKNARAIIEAAGRIVEKGLSVRQAEALVLPKRSTRPRSRKAKSPDIIDLEYRLRTHFGTKVDIRQGKRHGRIVIEYYSSDDLTRIVDRLDI